MEVNDDSAQVEWIVTWILAFPSLFASITEQDDQAWLTIAWHSIWNVYPRASNKQLTALGVSDPVGVPMWEDSLLYGEMYGEDVLGIIKYLSQNNQLGPGGCVVDLGSGTGKALLAAVLGHSFQTAIGIEIVPSLHERALDNYSHWRSIDLEGSSCVFHWFCSDFVQKHEIWVEHADVILIHATAFEEALIQALTRLCEKCKPGTIFCLISRPLESSSIQTMEKIPLEMTWGRGSLYIQQKIYSC